MTSSYTPARQLEHDFEPNDDDDDAFFQDFTLDAHGLTQERGSGDASFASSAFLPVHDHALSLESTPSSQLSSSLYRQQPVFDAAPSASGSVPLGAQEQANPRALSLTHLGGGLRRISTPTRPLDSFSALENDQSATTGFPEYHVGQLDLGIQQHQETNNILYTSTTSQGPTEPSIMPMTVGSLPRPIPLASPRFPGSPSAQSLLGSATTAMQTSYFGSPPTTYGSPTASSTMHYMSPLLGMTYSTSPRDPSLISHSLPASQQMLQYYPQSSTARSVLLRHQQQQQQQQVNFMAQSPLMSIGERQPSLLSQSPSMHDSASDRPIDKKERNRLAAERCRRKKADTIQQLTIENHILRQENGELIKINLVLEQKLEYLVGIMASYGISIPK